MLDDEIHAKVTELIRSAKELIAHEDRLRNSVIKQLETALIELAKERPRHSSVPKLRRFIDSLRNTLQQIVII